MVQWRGLLLLSLWAAGVLLLHPGLGMAQEDEAVDEESSEGGSAEDPAPDPGPEPRAGILDAAIPLPAGADEATTQEYEAYRQAAQHYVRSVNEYRADLQIIVDLEYQRKLSQIDQVYSGQIDSLRDQERSARHDAIARLETFRQKHSDNDRYLPGVLYRLAVLSYEQADDEFMSVPLDKQTAEHPDFSASLSYSEELIHRYPDFPQLDGVYYLYGFCLQQMERPDEARDAFLALIAGYPDSPKLAEANTRVGEYYFSMSQDAVQGMGGEVRWAEAGKYYQAAVDLGPSYQIYDRALYRLAWTDYYIENYDAMIHRFMELVDYADRVPQGSVLRQEAIEFMAAVLAEEDWNLRDDISRDPDFGMVRFDRYLNEGRPFELEVLRKYAETLMEQTRFDFAAQAYAALLERDPCNADNPQIHQSYIAALNFSGETDQAVVVQSQLDKIYGKGSSWYGCQEEAGNLEAIAFAENLSRKSLKYSINTYWTQTNEIDERMIQLEDALANARNPAERQRIEAELVAQQNLRRETYALTAQIASDLLERYPNDEEVYLYRYILAESYYGSEQYEQAALSFEKVRDVGDGRFRRDTANGAILARTVLLERAVEAGTDPLGLAPSALKERYLAGAVPADMTPTYMLREHAAEGSEEAQAELEARAGARTPKRELPPEVTTLVAARDKYLEYNLDELRGSSEEPYADDYRFLNAMVYYHYGDYEQARPRFEEILTLHADSPFAMLTAGFLIATYEEEGNLDRVAEVSDRLREMSLGEGKQAAELDAKLKGIKYGALFEKANNLYQAEEYAAAAAEYERIANENPEFENIHLALYNAGVAYEKIRRYESAMRLYRRVYTEYNETDEAADALYRVGLNGEKFFDFDVAVESFILLHDTDREAFRKHPDRVDAMRRAAIILKYQAEYARAAKLFERYHDEHGSQSDAPAMLYDAGLMYEELGSYNEMARVFDRFRSKYGSDPEQRVLVLTSYSKQADYFVEKKDYKRAVGFYDKALSLYMSSPSVGGREANYLAAKAQFMLGDIEFRDWEKLGLSGNLTTFKKKMAEKLAASKRVAAKFLLTQEYKNTEWTLASNYRIGTMMHEYARTMEEAACPSGLDEDECDGFREQMIEVGLDLKAQARQYYEAVLEFGRQNGVSNRWTKSSLNALNDIAPKEFPVFEGERSGYSTSTMSPRSTLSPSDLERAKAPKDVPAEVEPEAGPDALEEGEDEDFDAEGK
ncbi:MAG: tetratricopeptide repeat protein [Myxococcota bacterium]|jgi:tetratricopeptide (TPR) repeat protein|nr:tetratricopeptide repeat protein [Myxococcota bacterium]